MENWSWWRKAPRAKVREESVCCGHYITLVSHYIFFLLTPINEYKYRSLAPMTYDIFISLLPPFFVTLVLRSFVVFSRAFRYKINGYYKGKGRK